VPIFRKDDGTALEHFWLLSFLTCAAPYQPAIGQPEAGNLLQLRIHRILAIARSYGYTALVLGAWGCGAFANDPYRTAVDFRDALENDFSGTFSDIVFAITDWTPERRFLGPFRGVFSIEQTDKTSSVNATPTANCNSSNFCSLAQDNSVVQESLNHRRECLNGFINILRYFKMRKIMERTKDWFGGLFLGQDAIQRKNTGELFRHRKIIVHESEFGHPVFADWYEPINTQENGKVYIIYLGGAIDKETYLSRTKTEPVVLRDIFFDTLNELKRFDICLLVIATPHGRNRCAKKMLGVFSDLLCNRFLPEVQARPDDCAAIIGNSLGAYFGLGLLPVLHGIYSFVSFGGAWMVEAAVQCNLSPENINWSLFSNSGDQLKAHIQGFVNWLRLRKVEAKLINRNGNHSFSSYLSNRSVRDGFMKALTLPRA